MPTDPNKSPYDDPFAGQTIGPKPELDDLQKKSELDKSIQLYMQDKNPQTEGLYIDESEYQKNPEYKTQVDQAKKNKYGFDPQYGKWEKKDDAWQVSPHVNAFSALTGGLIRVGEKSLYGKDAPSTVSAYDMPDEAYTRGQRALRTIGEGVGYLAEYAPFGAVGEIGTNLALKTAARKAIETGFEAPIKSRLKSYAAKKMIGSMITDAAAFGTINGIESRGDPEEIGWGVGMGLAFPPAVRYGLKPAYNAVKKFVSPYAKVVGDGIWNSVRRGLGGLSEKQVQANLENPNVIKGVLAEGVEAGAEKLAAPAANLPAATALEPASGGIRKFTPQNPMPLEKATDLALKKTETLPKYAGNVSINLENVKTTDDVKNLINNVSEGYKTEMMAAKRNIVSHEETQKLAENMGMTAEQLLKRRKGQAMNAHEALAAREILTKSAEDTHALAVAAQAGDEKAAAKFIEQMYKHVAIQEQITGIAGEAGRALNAFKIAAARSKSPEEVYKQIIKAVGGKERFTQEIAKRVAELDVTDFSAVNQFLREAAHATKWDKINEAWINSLLSGPKTHIANAASNTLTMLTKPFEQTGAAAVDVGRAILSRTPRERFLGEPVANTFGMIQGFPEGLRAGLQAFKTEIPSQGLSKIETNHKNAIKGTLGRMVRIPGRLLMMSDEIFKGMNYSAELYTQAYRQAAKEGVKNPLKLGQRIAELVGNPSDEMKTLASKEATYRTFQNDLGPWGQRVSGLREIPGVRYIIPFLKTPINVAKYGLERTPLNYLRIIHKARLGELAQGELSDELSRATLGSLIAAGTASLASQGLITGGGPRDTGQRNALRASGWQPYSVKIGDKWYSYGRLEPLAMVMGMTSDFVELNDAIDSDQAVSKIQFAIAQNLMNKTFLKGLSDTINAISYPEMYGEKWVSNYAGSFVPTGLSQVADAIDTAPRNTKGVKQKVMSRIPGLREDLPLFYDIWGQPIAYQNTSSQRLLSPIQVSPVVDDPTTNFVIKIKADPGSLRKYLTKKGQKIDLTDDEFASLNQLAGQRAKKRIERVMQNSVFMNWDEDRQREKIDEIFQESKQWARDRIDNDVVERAKKKGLYKTPQMIRQEKGLAPAPDQEVNAE